MNTKDFYIGLTVKVLILAISIFNLVFIVTSCSRPSKEEMVTINKDKTKYSVKVKYANEPWIKYDNVISVKPPDRHDMRTVIEFDDGTRLSIVGGNIVWTDNIPLR